MDKEKIAESTLRTQFKMEMLVYSQDRTYSTSWSDNKKMEEETMIKKPVKTLYTVSVKDNKATLQELMLHLKSYYRVSLNSDGHQTSSHSLPPPQFTGSSDSFSDCHSAAGRPNPTCDSLPNVATVCCRTAEGDDKGATG